MLKNAPLWVALLLGTLLGMVAQSVLSKKQDWFASLCVADQPGWTCFLIYTLGFATFGLLCVALWSALLFIRRNYRERARVEQETLQIFVEMISSFNKEIVNYLQPLEKRFFIETMQTARQRQDFDTIAYHKNYMDYRNNNTQRYNALSRRLVKIHALLTVVDLSSETEKSVANFMNVVDGFFKYENEQTQHPTGDSILELTSGFIEIEKRKIADHRIFGERIGSAYQEFARHLALDPRYRSHPPH